MDAMVSRLVENGFAFIAFLAVSYLFISRVLSIQDRSSREVSKAMRDIVTEVHNLVNQQRADSDRLMDSINQHDAHSHERHNAVMTALTDHHRIASAVAERMERSEVRADRSEVRAERSEARAERSEVRADTRDRDASREKREG